MKAYKNCQSCAMPLNKDSNGLGGGIDSDGKPSNKYCSYCYNEGKFLQPNITAEEMQIFVKGKLKERGLVYEIIRRYIY